MLLTVKSIRIKRMNVEIFCERGVRWDKRRSQGRVALFLGRSLGRGVLFLRRLQGRKGVGRCFWGVCRGKQRSQEARTACMIVFAADVRFFCKFEFYVHIHYYF